MSNQFYTKKKKDLEGSARQRADVVQHTFDSGQASGFNGSMGYIRIMKDEHGYICDPENIKYKCGWGETLYDALIHMKKREIYD